MQQLDWDDLRHFLAAARAGGLVRAAAELGVNHATVGRRLSALETALGSRLFERGPGGSRLTATGENLLAHAERVEAEIALATARLAGGDARISGTVRLATPEAFGTWLVAPEAHRLHAAHPDLQLELVPEPQAVSLANREADLAVLLGRPLRGPVVSRHLADYRLGLYASRQWLDANGPVRADRLGGLPFAWYVDARIEVPELRFLAEVSPGANTVFRSTSIAAQHAAVAGGLGLGMLHVFAAQHDERLVRVLPETIEVRRSYWLAFHADQQRLPRVRAVADFLDSLVGAARTSL